MSLDQERKYIRTRLAEVYRPQGVALSLGNRGIEQCLRDGEGEQVLAWIDGLAEGTFS